MFAQLLFQLLDDLLPVPALPVPDNNIKAGIFPGKVIIVKAGKLSMFGDWSHIQFWQGVGVRFPHAIRHRSPCIPALSFLEKLLFR
jgi:hypothetical protein